MCIYCVIYLCVEFAGRTSLQSSQKVGLGKCRYIKITQNQLARGQVEMDLPHMVNLTSGERQWIPTNQIPYDGTGMRRNH